MGDNLPVAQTIGSPQVDSKPQPQLNGNGFSPVDVKVEAWPDLDARGPLPCHPVVVHNDPDSEGGAGVSPPPDVEGGLAGKGHGGGGN